MAIDRITSSEMFGLRVEYVGLNNQLSLLRLFITTKISSEAYRNNYRIHSKYNFNKCNMSDLNRCVLCQMCVYDVHIYFTSITFRCLLINNSMQVSSPLFAETVLCSCPTLPKTSITKTKITVMSRSPREEIPYPIMSFVSRD